MLAHEFGPLNERRGNLHAILADSALVPVPSDEIDEAGLKHLDAQRQAFAQTEVPLFRRRYFALASVRFRAGRKNQKRLWLLFRRARFVNGPPVPAGGTMKDQRTRQLIFDEGNRTLARGADEAGVSRWAQWCGTVHVDRHFTLEVGKADTRTEHALLAES
jgi:hypothetical protein